MKFNFDNVKLAIMIMIYVVSFMVFIFQVCNDITRKQFTTTVYIVIADVVEVLILAVLCYLSFTGYKGSIIAIILKRSNTFVIVMVIFCCAVVIRGFLESENFKKRDYIDLKDTERFVKKWENVKQKGKLRYVLAAGTMSGIAIFVGSVIGIVDKMHSFHELMALDVFGNLACFVSGFIGGALSSLEKWKVNEEKYDDLVSIKKYME